MKDYHMYGWRIFMLFYVCTWKTHHLSPKQKESFYALTMVGLGAFTFSHRELSCSSLSLLHLFSALHSEVNAQLVGVENVISV